MTSTTGEQNAVVRSIETPFLAGCRDKSLDYPVIACERVR
jgi:hypothetical protein